MGWIRFLGRYLEEIVACACLVVMCAATFANVVARYVMNAPIVSAEEIARYSFIWLVFVGAAVCSKRNAHIAVDAVVLVLPQIGKQYCKLLVGLGTSALMAVLVWYGIRLSASATQPTSTLGIPTYWIYGMVPLAALSVLLRTLLELRQDVRSVVGGSHR